MVQNGAPLGQMVIKLGLETSAFSDSLTGATRAVKTSVKEMETGFRVLDNGGKKIDALTYKQEGLTKVISAQEKELAHLKTAYEKTLDAEGKATSTTAKAAQKYNEAQAKLSGYEAQLKTTAGEIARYKVETEGVTGAINKHSDSLIDNGQKLTKIGDGLSSFGGSMTKYVTAPLTLGMGTVTAAAISWESAFAGVKKTNDEVVDSNGNVTYSYKDLEDGLRGLAKELPATHSEIAGVAEAAGQLGIQTENVTAFTKTMIDMGESTNMSAEEAATALARFANITQMSQQDFDRLGSVIVDLGNNFATTEAEITNMGLRLAGAGSQIGMSEAEIMGFAAALSSVGVEAEAGGSAFSKVMIQMQLATESGGTAFDGLAAQAENAGLSMDQVSNAVRIGGKELKGVAGQMGYTSTELRTLYKEADNSAVSLNNFAEVAGLTDEQFSQMFKDDPAAAIMKFVEGLANAEEQGSSAIKVLDDMDITEVRLRDSLLRAAGASGVFEDAIKTGNKAWAENTALTEEADKRYETTASKLKMLKNEATDAAIEFGGPLVDALRDGLDAAKPLIKSLGNMATAFSELDEDTQRNIVKWGLFAAALGPAAKGLGGIISITGKTSTALGGMGKSIVDLAANKAERAAIEGVGTSIATVGTSAGTATGASGIGGFTSALGGLNPYVLGAVGILAVGAAAWWAYDSTVGESSRKTAQWGADIDDATAKSLGKYKEFSDGGQQALRDLDSGTSTSAKNIKESFEGMATDIGESGEKAKKKIKEAIEQLPIEQRKAAEEIVQQQQESIDRSVQVAEEASIKVAAIYEKHNYDVSKFTDDEKQIVVNSARMMNAEKVRLMELSAEEEKTVLAALNGDIDDMTSKQREKAMKDLIKVNTDTHSELLKSKQAWATILGEGTPEYEAKIKELETIHKASTDQIAINMIKLAEANGESSDSIRTKLGQLGVSYTDKARLMREAGMDMSKTNDLIAESTNEMSEEVRDARLMWENLVLDEKTADIKSNAQEEVTKAVQSSEGWNDMKLILQNANLTSNAKEMIFQAIQESGRWNEYEIDDKLLKADNVQLIQSLIDSKGSLDEYNNLTPVLKTLIADGHAEMTFDDTRVALEQYEALTPEMKGLLASNEDVVQKLFNAESSLNIYDANNPKMKLLQGNSSNVDQAARTGEGSLNKYSSNNPKQKLLTGNSTNVSNSASSGERSLNSFNRNNPSTKYLSAVDDASYSAGQATESVNSFWRLPDVITKKLSVIGDWLGFEKGTDHHPGGMAMVNDQKGPLYKEMVTLPTGQSFIPEGRNVFLPLPKGSKVLPARQTRNMFPNYAGGVGVPSSTTNVQQMKNINASFKEVPTQSTDSRLNELIGQLVYELARFRPLLEENGESQVKLLKGILNKDTDIILDSKVLAHSNNRVNAVNDLINVFN